MGFFQDLAKQASGAINSLTNKKETFTFANLPKNVAELRAMPEAALTSPFQTAALTVAALCNYENSVQDTIDMINYLKGPQPLSPYEIQFLRDRLAGKEYVTFSFFAGSNPQNNYIPTQPYTITVEDYAYSYQQEGYVMLQLRSSGADSPRQIKMRSKGNQWFLWENFLLSDIRTPAALNPWA